MRKGAISSISRQILCTGIHVAFMLILIVFSPKRKKGRRKKKNSFYFDYTHVYIIGVIANSTTTTKR